jgi:hypothetical protein
VFSIAALARRGAALERIESGRAHRCASSRSPARSVALADVSALHQADELARDVCDETAAAGTCARQSAIADQREFDAAGPKSRRRPSTQ